MIMTPVDVDTAADDMAKAIALRLMRSVTLHMRPSLVAAVNAEVLSAVNAERARIVAAITPCGCCDRCSAFKLIRALS